MPHFSFHCQNAAACQTSIYPPPLFQTLPKALFIQYNMYEKEERIHVLPSKPQPHIPRRLKKKENSYQTQTRTPKQADNSSDDEIFQPEYHTMKKLHLPIKRKLNKGAWALPESKIYLNFLESHLDSFNSEAQRRVDRVFCQMSEALQRKRTPDQCRSHHQKLLTRCRNVERMVDYLREKIREVQEAYPLRYRQRVIGKLLYRKRQASEQEVLRIEEFPFGCMKIFKNSTRLLIQIRDVEIGSYSLD